jgi:ABC-type nitrate/sulfonate/bicarbonate transport system substrate-binding protein
MRKSRTVIWVSLLVALALVVAACSDGGGATSTTATTLAGEATTAPPGELQKVTFALTNQRAIQYYPYYLADYLGYYEAEGLDVEIVIVSGSGATVQQLVAGNADIGHPSAPATAQAVSQGQCLKQPYTYAHVNVYGLATPADSGIETLQDLQDKVVGVSEPGGGEIIMVRAVLAGVGLAENVDYTIAAVGEGGPLTVQALQNGDAQAYSSSIFDVASVEANGMPLRQLLPDEFRYFPSNSIVVTCDYYEANKDVVTRFARAVAKATVFGEANPDAAWEITKTYEPELFEDEALARAIWDVTVDMITPPPALADAPLGSHYREGWNAYLAFATQGTEEEGALPPDSVDVNEVLTDELIGEINNFDRAAVEAEAGAFPGVG